MALVNQYNCDGCGKDCSMVKDRRFILQMLGVVVPVPQGGVPKVYPLPLPPSMHFCNFDCVKLFTDKQVVTDQEAMAAHDEKLAAQETPKQA